ncbi:MAG: hypothetical protein ACTHJQ_22270 [Rhizobiaceae bacterium]
MRRAGLDPRTAAANKASPQPADRNPPDDAAGMPANFAALAETYLKSDDFLAQRCRRQAERRIRYYLLNGSRNPWVNKPAKDVSDTDIAGLVVAIKQHSPSQARQVLQDIKLIFALGASPLAPEAQRLSKNPAAGLSPKKLKLKKLERQVILTDDEIVAFWRAAETLGYPYGPYFQLLLVLGTRRSELADAPWSEFDFRKRLWTIPPARFKPGSMHSFRFRTWRSKSSAACRRTGESSCSRRR